MHTKPDFGLRLLFLVRRYLLVVELTAMVYDFSYNACRHLNGPHKAAANEFDLQFQAHKQQYQNAGISMVWLKPTSVYLDEFPKPTIKSTPKRSQEHLEPVAQKKRRIDDQATDLLDDDLIGVYLLPEPPATKTVKVMMSRKRLMMVPYAESRLRNSPKVKNIPMARITHAQLVTILRCIERSDNHPGHLQEAIRASVYAKRLNNNDELSKTISQKVSDWIREGSLSRTQLKECHAAAMEHTDWSETTFPHAAALYSSHQSSGHVYPEVLLQQEKRKQSNVRKWLAQYVIRNGLGKPITDLVAHWQKEGDIPALELDLRLVCKFYMKERR